MVKRHNEAQEAGNYGFGERNKRGEILVHFAYYQDMFTSNTTAIVVPDLNLGRIKWTRKLITSGMSIHSLRDKFRSIPKMLNENDLDGSHLMKTILHCAKAMGETRQYNTDTKFSSEK